MPIHILNLASAKEGPNSISMCTNAIGLVPTMVKFFIHS